MRSLVAQMARFGVAGVAGFTVDTAVVYALRGRLGLYGAALVSYVLAASCNWAINRSWTFRDRGGQRAERQWALFLLTGLVGFTINRGGYFVLIANSAACRAHPVIALAGGTLAGMGINFLSARQIVFRKIDHRSGKNGEVAENVPPGA